MEDSAAQEPVGEGVVEPEGEEQQESELMEQ